MSQPEPKHPILTDRPADKDALDFQPYIDSLADLLMDPATSTPLTVGIFGQWGSGKTSLMQMIQAQVARLDSYRTVWFNAWKYDREDVALWRALILRTLDALRPRKDDGTLYTFGELPDESQQKLVHDLDRLEQSVYQTVEWAELGQWTVDWARALEGTVEGAAEIALSLVPGATPLVELLKKARSAVKGDDTSALTNAFQREAREFRREQLRSVEQFITTFEDTIQEHIAKQNGRLVIFIDDLDRCLPERTIEVLEAIKLFLDVPGCFFILGVDPAKIQEGIQLRYKIAQGSDEGANYLEKIIQVPFILPTIERGDMQTFVQSLNVDFPSMRCADVFAQGLEPNPRQIKRAINIFLLLWKLAGRRRLKGEAAEGPTPPLLSDVLMPLRLAKVVAIQHSYTGLYDLLKLTPRYLRELEMHYRREAQSRQSTETRQAGDVAEAEASRQTDLPAHLDTYAKHAGLRRLLTLFLDDEEACFQTLTPIQLRLYFSLAGRAETERHLTQAQSDHFEPELVLIPEGDFLMGSTDQDTDAQDREKPQHTVALPAFYIGRYPVTNLEYKAFVEATGHHSPRHWQNGQFSDDLADHPVVYVSWIDAVAYCRWLSEVSGQFFRLPTEAEWEKAARGTDGRRYPWGDRWDVDKANTKESGLASTTPVGQYSPKGDSPYSLADMAGNVWEWCITTVSQGGEYKLYPYDVSKDKWSEDYLARTDIRRILRGGSWFSEPQVARSAFRLRNYPLNSVEYFGFRFVSPI